MSYIDRETRQYFFSISNFILLLILLLVNGTSYAVEVKALPVTSDQSAVTPVRAVVLRDYPPLYMLDENNQPTGFAIDILKQVAWGARLDIKYVLVDNWAQAMEAVRSGKGDLIPGIGVTSVRQAEFAFTSEMESIPVSCFVLTDNVSIHNIYECSVLGRKVAVQTKSAAETMLQASGGYQLVSYDSIDTALNSLLAGQVEAFVFPEPVLKKKLKIMGLDGRLKVVGKPIEILTRGYLLRKEDELFAKKISVELHNLVSSAKYTKMYLKWYGDNESYWTAGSVFMWMAMLLGVAVLAIIFFICWKFISVARINLRLICNQDMLKQSEQNLKTTLSSIGDAVLATNLDMEVTQMNPAAEEFTGWKISEAVGRPVNEVFNITDLNSGQKAANPIEQVLLTKSKATMAANTILTSRDGRKYNIADSASPIMDTDGKMQGVVLVFRDVTEEYQMRDKINQSQKLDAIGQLAGGVAHDFNNMLGGIMGGAELLKIQLPDDQQQCHEYLSMILDSSTRAADLAKNLLLFARREAASSTPIDIHKVINSSVAILEKTIDKRISIETNLNAESAMTVGDDSQMQSIFLNLGINASHAMPDGGNLKISTKLTYLDDFYCSSSTFDLAPGDYIQIDVRDTGKGIAKEELQRIFEPFYTTKEQGMGTGLGLAAAYGTIQQHKGSITVYSEEGHGTRFTIMLPVSRQQNTPELQNRPATYGEGTVLLVDDEEVMRLAGKGFLTQFGYKVLLAQNGKEAVELYRDSADEIDLVVLDMIMPVMNGRDCFYELKKINPDVRVVLSSGFSKQEDFDDLQSSGLSGFIQKPFRGAEFSYAVANALKKQTVA